MSAVLKRGLSAQGCPLPSPLAVACRYVGAARGSCGDAGGGKKNEKPCRKALREVVVKPNEDCPLPCAHKKPPEGNILQRIMKLKFVEGGTNFGTPFRRLECKKPPAAAAEPPPEQPPAPAEPAPRPAALLSRPRPGVQISILGAETTVGQYLALLLKQCPCVRKLNLYDAKESQYGARDSCKVCADLHIINTNCKLEAFSCCSCDLERCLQNSDIVMMLESGQLDIDTSFEKRFCYQAPIVKRYADACTRECPKAFIVVCATPVDCMVPLIAETFKEVGFYDPRRILGSMAVPEMRANSLAARALCLDPRCTRVPCVGGSEGTALVPLFSKAVEYFDFAEHNAEMLTAAVRSATAAVARSERNCVRSADLSEAYALAGLTTKVAHALLCHDTPVVSAYVANDSWQFIAPARYCANPLELGPCGVARNLGLPKMSYVERRLTDAALMQLGSNLSMAEEWYLKFISSLSCLENHHLDSTWLPRNYARLNDCAHVI